MATYTRNERDEATVSLRCEGPREAVIALAASARALAGSCTRARFLPFAIDRFADADLVASGVESRRVPPGSWPDGVLAELERLPALPIVWGGAFESHLELLAAISRRRPLLGTPLHGVARAKDPFVVAEVLRAAGVATPAVRADEPGARDGWLSKPLRGSGGGGIRAAVEVAPSSDRFLQARASGLAASAVFVAHREESRVTSPAETRRGARALLVGVTRQLVGVGWLAAPAFSYCGTVAPLALARSTREQVQRAGDALARELGLVGVFGIDFLLDGDRAVIIEVNPRYTAAVEIVERVLGVAIVDLHVRASRDEPVAMTLPDAHHAAAKAVVFASPDARFVPPSDAASRELARRYAWLADTPLNDQAIAAGEPAFTICCDAPDCESAWRRVRELAGILRAECLRSR